MMKKFIKKINLIICLVLVVCVTPFILVACDNKNKGNSNDDQSNKINTKTDIALVLKNTNQKIDEVNNALANYYNSSSVTPSSIAPLSLRTQSADADIYNLFTIGKDDYRWAVGNRDWVVNPVLNKYAIIEYICWKYDNDAFGINYDVQQDVYDYGNVHMSMYFQMTCENNTLTMNYYNPNHNNDTLVKNHLAQTTLTFDDNHNPLCLSVNFQDYNYTDVGHGIYLKHQTITYDFQDNHVISMLFQFPDANLTFAEISNKAVVTKEWLQEKTGSAEYIDFNLNDINKSQIVTKYGTCNGGNYKDEAWQIIMDQYTAFDFFDQQTFIEKIQSNLQICPQEEGNAVCNYSKDNYKFVYDAATDKFTYIRKRNFYGEEIENGIEDDRVDNFELTETEVRIPGCQQINDSTFRIELTDGIILYPQNYRGSSPYYNVYVAAGSSWEVQRTSSTSDIILVPTGRTTIGGVVQEGVDIVCFTPGEYNLDLIVHAASGQQQIYTIQIVCKVPKKEITFDANDGTGRYLVREVPDNADLNQYKDLFEREGYEIHGWQKSDDHTVKAVWRAKRYALRYIYGGICRTEYFTIESETFAVANAETDWLLELCNNSNMKFLGWYYDSEPTQQMTDTEILQGTTGDITLIGKFEGKDISG